MTNRARNFWRAGTEEAVEIIDQLDEHIDRLNECAKRIADGAESIERIAMQADEGDPQSVSDALTMCGAYARAIVKEARAMNGTA